MSDQIKAVIQYHHDRAYLVMKNAQGDVDWIDPVNPAYFERIKLYAGTGLHGVERTEALFQQNRFAATILYDIVQGWKDRYPRGDTHMHPVHEELVVAGLTGARQMPKHRFPNVLTGANVIKRGDEYVLELEWNSRDHVMEIDPHTPEGCAKIINWIREGYFESGPDSHTHVALAAVLSLKNTLESQAILHEMTCCMTVHGVLAEPFARARELELVREPIAAQPIPPVSAGR